MANQDLLMPPKDFRAFPLCDNMMVLQYVDGVYQLPASRSDYMRGIEINDIELEEIILGILKVHEEMNDHCTNFDTDIQHRIMAIARHLSSYCSNAEVRYGYICSTIRSISTKQNCQEDKEELDRFIDEQVERILRIKTEAETAHEYFQKFVLATKSDIEKAEIQDKNLDDLLSKYNVELKKYEDSRTDQHKLIRDADTPANLGIRRIVDRLPFSGKKKQRKVAVKKLDGITENIKLGEEAKSIGNGCMDDLREIHKKAKFAAGAVDSMIGSFDYIGKDMRMVKELVHNDIRELDEVVGESQVTYVVSKWRELGKSAEEYLAKGFLTEMPKA